MGINEFLVESELTWNNIMVESMNIETRYLLKDYLLKEDDEEIFSESINEVYQKVKEWIKKQIAFIKDLFSKLITKLKSLINKIAKNVKMLNTNNLKLFECPTIVKIECIDTVSAKIYDIVCNMYTIACKVSGNTTKEQADNMMSTLEAKMSNIKNNFKKERTSEPISANIAKKVNKASSHVESITMKMDQLGKGLLNMLSNMDKAAAKNMNIQIMKSVYTALVRSNSYVLNCVNVIIQDINRIVEIANYKFGK